MPSDTDTETVRPSLWSVPDQVGHDDLIAAVDRGFRRLDRTVSIGLALIAGAIIGASVRL